MKHLNRSQEEFLKELLWLKKNDFVGMFSGRRYRKKTAKQLEAKGYLEQKMLVVADGDGFTKEPERWRIGWVLTNSGQRLCDKLGLS